MKKQFKFGIIIEDVKEGLLVKQYEKKYIKAIIPASTKKSPVAINNPRG